mmetsp:Transcript_286/g.737  ORF Transcript_286/g.737 Transcript_286/m.737 type:complete len:289 (+) Transcript_286:968-1834(+)
MLWCRILDIGDNFLFQVQVFKDGFDYHVCLSEMFLQVGTIIGQTNHVGGIQVVLKFCHSPAFQFLVPIIPHVRFAAFNSCVVAILEKYRYTLFGSDLSNSCPHETRTHNSDCIDWGCGIAKERILFHLGHSVENSNQSFRFFRCRKLCEFFAFVLELSCGIGYAVLNTSNDGIRCGVFPVRVFLHHFVDLVPQNFSSNRRVLQKTVHQGLGFFPWFELSVDNVDGTFDSVFFDGLRSNHQINESHFLGLVGADVFPRQHHVHCVLKADKLVEILSSAKSGKQSELDFW